MKLFRKKEIWCPTVTGWLLILGVAAGFLFSAVAGLYLFLAPNKPVNAGILVVEGWLEDAELPQVVDVFEEGGYKRIVATGCDITFARELTSYASYAEVTYHRLLQAGMETNQVQWVTCGYAPRDRTYSAAVALRDFLKGKTESVDLVSVGAHARRSQRLFQLAMGSECEVGVVSIVPQAFDNTNWWKCSDGFRHVINEAVAWFYARWVFDPEQLKNEQ